MELRPRYLEQMNIINCQVTVRLVNLNGIKFHVATMSSRFLNHYVCFFIGLFSFALCYNPIIIISSEAIFDLKLSPNCMYIYS